jgi:leader peptidase (prepilin peptidase)/N-methyltransferase
MFEPFSSSPALFIVVVVLLALLVGSFLNVVIYRLPLMMQREWRLQADEIVAEPGPELPDGPFNLVLPRSRCPSCGEQIAAANNIPVVSWLILRGKCANCKSPISMRYPAIEAMTALLTGMVAWRFGFGVEALAAIVLTWVLIAICFIDIDHQLIPDSMSMPLIWIGLFLSLFHPMSGSEMLFVAPKDAIVGALAGYLSLWSVNYLFRMIRGKDGMGYGDFKLLAALGAWLGYQMLPMIILVSAAVGATIGIGMIIFLKHDRRVPIPYGPYLATAGWVAMMWGPALMDRYMDLAMGGQ